MAGLDWLSPLSGALRRDVELLDPTWYRAAYGIALDGSREVLRHYRKSGSRHGLDPNPLFDTNWYAAKYRKQIRRCGADPLTHFVEQGWKKGCQPNPFFDTELYLTQVPQREIGLLGPLQHYLEKGAAEHLVVDRYFDSKWYSATQIAPDAWPWPALAHYLRIGAGNGLAGGPGVVDASGRHAVAWYKEAIQSKYTRMISSSGPADIADLAFKNPRGLDDGGTGRIAVYTAIFGDYDTLKLPHVDWTAGADFYCFTDRCFSDSGPWRLVKPDYHNIDPTRTARFYKLHPHVYFRRYDFAIWMDGNIALLVDPRKLVDEVGSAHDIMFLRHPERATLTEEAARCVERFTDERPTIRDQMNRYITAGYVQKSPLLETNVIVFKPRHERVRAFLGRWWSEIDRGTKRDQISVNFSADMTPGLSFGLLSDISARQSRRFLAVKHG